MASICNDSAFNDVLPQILLENFHRFPVKAYKLSKESWQRIFICGGKKARGTIIESCANTLSFFVIGSDELCGKERCSSLLTWQLAIYRSIHSYALDRGVRMILAPAGMTGVLQLLDISVFRL